MKRFFYGVVPGMMALLIAGCQKPAAPAAAEEPDALPPLYEELFSDVPNRHYGDSAFIWQRPIEAEYNTDFAIQYGQEYELETMLDEYRKFRLHPFAYEGDSINKLRGWAEKSGVGAVLYAPYYKDNGEALYDPEAYRRFMERVEQVLIDNKDLVWGVSIGDEVFFQYMYRYLGRVHKPEEVAKNKWLAASIDTIRHEYGYGKYGPPKSQREVAPFQHLAMRRWLCDRILQMQRDIYSICLKYKAPDGKPVRVIGTDHCNWALMQHQSRMAPYQDIATAQIIPSEDPWNQNIAFRAKLLRDLTGNDIWVCAHTEHFIRSLNCAQTAEYLSQAARGGGTGIQIWNYDWPGDCRNKGGTMFDWYGHKPRWDQLMDTMKRFAGMNVLKFPEADFAILTSNDTSMSLPKMYIHEYETAFNFFGPACGSWFRFISDLQLLDGKADLADWPMVMIPKATIVSPELRLQLQRYVENGGKILCFDNSFAAFDPAGEETAWFGKSLFGATMVKTEARDLAVTGDGEWAKFNGAVEAGATSRIEPEAGTDVVLRFADGSAAVTIKRYPNGGEAWLLALPFRQRQVALPEWRQFYRTLLTHFNVKLGHDIWRFRFPVIEEKKPEFAMQCLTGNHFYWWLNKIETPANVVLPNGKYTYSVAPDNGGTEFGFPEGRLTNRLKAPDAGDLGNRTIRARIKAGRIKLSRADFADTWSGTDPVTVRFDFGAETTVEEVVFYCHGVLPAWEVVIGGQRFAGESLVTEGVKRVSVKIPAVRAASLEVNFGSRPEGSAMTLCEAEIWGKQ
ncbi:MAG: hypothetical protein IJC73_06840 [Lentisphaeria bacterium]|nr:hypothetical protein [Lentisphaeria bacterium]